ncbi:MAG: cytochrome c [Proteobacteria bacterium]|nr:cytochrome c [Pseudomonadota bacterium]
MKVKLVATLMFGALALGAGTALAGPADDAITARQACMKANGAAMGSLVPIAKGEKAFDAAAVAEAVGKIETACSGFAGWWGEDTQKGETLQTWAKPEIWSDAAGFQAAGSAYGAGLAAVKTATDEATFKDGFAKFGASCGGCHQKFRMPKG